MEPQCEPVCFVCLRPMPGLCEASFPLCDACWNTPAGRQYRERISHGYEDPIHPFTLAKGGPPPDPCHLTLDQLQELCTIWQKRLRLQDWVIRIVLVPAREITGTGRCSYEIDSKSALVQILRPEDYSGDRDLWPYDMEEVLVHELLHLHWAPLKTREGSPEETAEEQAVASLAGALTRLSRGQA